MGQKFLVLLLLLLCASAVYGQQTTVNATVVGPNGAAWSNATGLASLVCPGNAQAYSGSTPVPRTQTIPGLNSAAYFQQVLYDTSLLVDVNHNPISCNYQMSFTDECGVNSFTTPNLTGITGTSPVSLSSQINAAAVNVSLRCYPGTPGGNPGDLQVNDGTGGFTAAHPTSCSGNAPVAQGIQVNGNANCISGAVGVFTIATLPGSPIVNQTAVVTDSSGGSCGGGGGTTRLLCQWNGSNWTSVGGGGGGGGSPGGSNLDVQVNVGGGFGNGSGGTGNQKYDPIPYGPNPYIDIRSAPLGNIRAGSPTTAPFTTGCTATGTGGTATVTLSPATSVCTALQTGDYVVIYQGGASPSVATPAAPTVTAIGAQGDTGTLLDITNNAGATTYSYCLSAVTFMRGFSACSPVGTTTTGAATLGSTAISINNCALANATMTCQTNAAHALVVGQEILLNGMTIVSGYSSAGALQNPYYGKYKVATVPDNTHFTFNTNADTRKSFVPTSATGGTLTYFLGVNIKGVTLTGNYQYAVYETAPSAKFLGFMWPQSAILDGSGEITYLAFDDFGSAITVAPSTASQSYTPTTAPGASQPEMYSGKICGGGGTTTLTLCSNLVTSVTSQPILYDAGPPLLDLMNTAQSSAVSMPIYIPRVNPLAFVINSPVDATSLGFEVGIQQAGQIQFNETLTLGITEWIGVPVSRGNIPSFGLENLPAVTVTGHPGIRVTKNNAKVNLYHLQINGGGNGNETLYLNDNQANVVIGSIWSHLAFTTGGGQKNGIPIVYRGVIGGTAGEVNEFWDYIAIPGPVNTWGTDTTPYVYFDHAGGGIDAKHISGSGRLFFFNANSQGTGGSFDWLYCQGCNTNYFFTNETVAGSAGIFSLRLNHLINDTGSSGLVASNGSLQTARVDLCDANAGTNGAPLFTGSYAIELKTCMNSTNGPNGFIPEVEDIIEALAIDGTFTTRQNQAQTLMQKRLGMPLKVPYAWGIYNDDNYTTPATCATITAGPPFAPAGTYGFTYSYRYPDGGWGQTAPASNSCTADGTTQQVTVTIPQSASAVGAVGIDINRSPGGLIGNLNAATLTGTQTVFTYSNQVTVGITPVVGASGWGGTRNGITWGKQLCMGLSCITAPNTTIARTATMPDVSGVNVVSSYQNSVYDDFNRANGAIGANWTVVNGGFNITSNAVSGTAGTANDAYWSATIYDPGQFSEVTITTLGANNGGPAVRMGTVAGYACSESTTTMFIVKNGSVLTSTGVTAAAGDIVRTEVITDTANHAVITCYQKSGGAAAFTNVLSFTDSSSPILTGSPGLHAFATSGVYDNWSGGNLHPIAQLDMQQDWIQPQHFTQAVTVGATNPIAGALTVGTVYAPNVAWSNGGFTATASSPTLTANRTISLADANLTVPTSMTCGTTTVCAQTNQTRAIILNGGPIAMVGGTITITSLPFTSATTYVCNAVDNTGNNPMSIVYNSGSSVTFNGTGTDTIRYNCTGN